MPCLFRYTEELPDLPIPKETYTKPQNMHKKGKGKKGSTKYIQASSYPQILEPETKYYMHSGRFYRVETPITSARTTQELTPIYMIYIYLRLPATAVDAIPMERARRSMFKQI